MLSQASSSDAAATNTGRSLLTVTASVTAMTALFWLYQYHCHSSHNFTGEKNKKKQSSPKEDPASSSGARSTTPSSKSTTMPERLPFQRQEDSLPEDDDDADDDEDNLHHLPLPQHLEREFYKDQRRRQMISFLSMKNTMYDNIGMLDPDGHHLCNISLKKANWYINKNIATWTDESTNDSIRLSFHPKMAARNKNPGLLTYNRGQKMNQCVVCGAQRDYMRHYIVPYCYRSLFPIRFKTHLPHDVVLLCAETCQARADSKAQKRMMRMERALRVDPETAQPQILDRQLQKVQSAAQALLKWNDRIPANRTLEYQKLLVDWWQLDSIDALTDQHLTQASQVEARRPNPKYIPGPHLVMNVLLKSDISTITPSSNSDSSDIRIAQFVRDWRRHFLQTVQPKFLPIGWSVDSPVQCDDRGSSKEV